MHAPRRGVESSTYAPPAKAGMRGPFRRVHRFRRRYTPVLLPQFQPRRQASSGTLRGYHWKSGQYVGTATRGARCDRLLCHLLQAERQGKLPPLAPVDALSWTGAGHRPLSRPPSTPDDYNPSGRRAE